ncbi:trypsin-like peptidase domain-containing protein [Tautonia plasticadhaerens]|uniref:Serine protease HhoB n=1 Tax=Tautonia plasticadhaerens TaxID=2527974 RepID=A0A518H770_9BACT|nr:trypsin-like peptidase domain-containing protein [Tautonia plasticadhaerens]QDV36674.1 Putative serine protease HhoB precursor [Tautonia plasticadhaerens]
MLLPWMTRRWLFWLMVATAGSSAAVPPATRPASADMTSRRTPLVEAIERAMPAVVNITSEKRASSNSRWPFSPEENRRPLVSGMGTGVVLDQRGFVLTNQHVVDQVNDIRVYLADGSSYPARILQEDRSMDLALLKVDAGRPLTPISIGTSSDLMIGETAITIGNAFGYENTASTGIVSALGIDVTLADDQVYHNLIQTDAGINPGNSGGPLINIDGELIGINVATRAGAQGIGFALPIDDVKPVAAGMLSTRKLVGTWHGLVAVERVLDGARRVVVSAIEAGSPAEEAGLKPGDELIRANNLALTNPIDLERALLDSSQGKPAALVVDRGGDRRELSLAPRPVSRTQAATTASPDSDEQVWRLLGLRTQHVTQEYVAVASPKLRGGLYVREILPGSLADQAAIRPGDILVGMHVGDRHLETIRPDNIMYILRQAETAGSQAVPYYIVRQNVLHQGTISLSEVYQAQAVSPTVR